VESWIKKMANIRFYKSPIIAPLFNGASPLTPSQRSKVGHQNIPFANRLISLIFAAIKN
jgi:hypothetical protein